MGAVKTLQPRKILQARLRRGFTQEDVAFHLRTRGVAASGKQVHRWERGSHAPRAAVIPALAEVLGVTIDQLYGDDDDEEEDLASVLKRAISALASHREYDLAAELQRHAEERS